MKSKLIPGRIRPISFIFVIPLVILSLIVGLIIGQITFNLAVGNRLHQLETQISPCEVTESPQSEDNAKIEQVFDQTSNKAENGYFANESERELIERVVTAESRGEPFEGMIAVAQTIKDRSDLWGMTPTEVVSKPNQYAKPYYGEIPVEVADAVSLVFEQGYRAIEEPTTHFHADYVNPYWADSKTSRGQIGNHRFYY